MPPTVLSTVLPAVLPAVLPIAPPGDAFLGTYGIIARVSPRIEFAHRAARALGVLDWIRIGVLAVGVVFVATGLLPADTARSSLERVAPLLLFLFSVIVLAELTKEAGVFDAIAQRMARAGRGNYVALFLLCVAFASATTIFLNLDTTAVLLTPVMLALAARAHIATLPLAMTTVWLANTASLLLPVSNLTNLLAADRVALQTRAFAARMWAPQLAVLAVTMALLWVFYWRRRMRGADSYDPPEPAPVKDRVLFSATGLACLVFIGAILGGVHTGIQLGVAATVAAAVAVAAFVVRDRSALRPALIPWQLMVFVTGLFLVVPTLERFGLDDAMRALVGGDDGVAGAFRAAFSGAGLSNVLNNLPAYVAGESAVPASNKDQLLSLLIGANVGPVITPWGSLATLLWFEWCRRWDVRVPIRKFVVTGTVLAVAGCAAAVPTLLLTG
ncbi:arsenite efflux membrane protein ArsB [Actinomadura pelletieri DSM 43383]|uniref:Arsenite efflux membrane protein ArsB n=1 Tax=Actinomadura pelletieri DSM 43383 TaxID=1120940 RepID=A0A495QNA3_9ACTN|nr:arsenite efflux membrane protein ArsB [Actinomadura pelletieri DSM 43383]